jgi:hypothetical protein
VNELNEKIKIIGGITLARFLFHFLTQHKFYSNRFERYLISRETSLKASDQKPQIPFGFLLNLSLKHPFEKANLQNQQSLINEIVALAKFITNGAYRVQPYSYLEFHFQSGETIIHFFQEIALWDSMFTLPQCRPSNALEITQKIFAFIDNNDFQTALGFTMQQLMLVTNEIYLIASKTNEPTIIYHSELMKKLRQQIDKKSILEILEFLSHSQAVNKTYILPSDYSSIDFFQKPLIKLGDTKFLLMDKSWCSPNFFEAIASRLRKSIPHLDSQIGNQLEVFLRSKLADKGITFSSGTYKVDEIDGECDLLIESERAIVLIELKKKVLTRKSKSGIDINILLDLSDSILSAQLQSGKVEIILREKKSITLTTKDGITKVINFNDRIIERVALSQLEFGGFHDRTITNQFLNALTTRFFKTYSTDPSIIKKFDELAKKQQEWIEQYKKLRELDEKFSHYPYFNCYFFSLPQLLEVINVSTGNNSFHDNLCKMKYVSLSTLDWYREWDYVHTE